MKMSATQRAMKKARKEQGGISAYRLSIMLGITRGGVSHWARGLGQADDVLAIRLAELAKIPAPLLIAEIHREKAKTPQEAAAWGKLSELAKSAGLTAAIFAAVLFSEHDAGFIPAPANQGSNSALALSPPALYAPAMNIMLSRKSGLNSIWQVSHKARAAAVVILTPYTVTIRPILFGFIALQSAPFSKLEELRHE